MTTITAERSTLTGTAQHRRRSPLRETLVITQRNLRHVARTPQLLAFSSLLPISFTLMFYYVLGGAVHAPGESYIDSLVPTMLILGPMFGATGAIAMAVDAIGGMIDRFRSLPIARTSVLTGRTVADLARTALSMALVLGIGFLLGFQFHNGFGSAIAALGVVLAFNFAFSWYMVWVGLMVKDSETASVAAFLPVFLLVFTSSGLVPVNTMPGWLQAFARNQPFTAVINTVRALSQGGPVFHWFWLTAAWSVAILVGFGILAIRRYRKI